MLMNSCRFALLNLCVTLAMALGLAAIPSLSNAAQGLKQVGPVELYDLCARAEGTDEANPVLQTLHVKMELNQKGVASDILKLVQAQLLALSSKSTLGPVNVFVEDYDSKICAAAGENFLQLCFALDAKQVAEINSGTTCGEFVIPSLRALLP